MIRATSSHVFALLLLFSGLAAGAFGPSSATAEDAVLPSGASPAISEREPEKLGPPPICDQGDRLKAASEALELARGPKTQDSMIKWLRSYPFRPRLEASGSGVSLIWTPDRGSRLQESGGNVVWLREWDSVSGWTVPAAVSEGGQSQRYHPALLIARDGAAYAAWLEPEVQVQTGGSDARIVGSVRTKGVWSRAIRLSDQPGKPLRLSGYRTDLVEDGEGKVHVFWTDSREEHFEWSLAHPGPEAYTKISRKVFGAPAETPAEQVSERGAFSVEELDLAAVGNPSNTTLDVLFGVRGRRASVDERDLFIVRNSGKGWGRPVRLLSGKNREPRLADVSRVSAERNSEGDLVVVYGGVPAEGTPADDFGSQVRLLLVEVSGGTKMTLLSRGWNGSRLEMAAGPNEGVFVAFQSARHKWNSKAQAWLGSGEEEAETLYVMLTEGGRCVDSAIVAETSVLGSFDIAADSNGRIHAVWVEGDGEEAVLKHRWFVTTRSSASGG